MKPNSSFNYHVNHRVSRKIHQFSMVGFARHLFFVFFAVKPVKEKHILEGWHTKYIHKTIILIIIISDTFIHSISITGGIYRATRKRFLGRFLFLSCPKGRRLESVRPNPYELKRPDLHIHAVASGFWLSGQIHIVSVPGSGDTKTALQLR